MKASIFGLVIIAASLAVSGVASAGPTKTYQVTGPILEMNDSMIVVEKEKGENERWEIARDSSTKANGELKVGEKVTITYTMTATEIETKGPSKAAKTSPSPAKK